MVDMMSTSTSLLMRLLGSAVLVTRSAVGSTSGSYACQRTGVPLRLPGRGKLNAEQEGLAAEMVSRWINLPRQGAHVRAERNGSPSMAPLSWSSRLQKLAARRWSAISLIGTSASSGILRLVPHNRRTELGRVSPSFRLTRTDSTHTTARYGRE